MSEQTHNLSEKDFAALGLREVGYMRPMTAGVLFDELREAGAKVMTDVPDDATIYAVRAADGSCLAIAGDPQMAVTQAREHNLELAALH